MVTVTLRSRFFSWEHVSVSRHFQYYWHTSLCLNHTVHQCDSSSSNNCFWQTVLSLKIWRWHWNSHLKIIILIPVVSILRVVSLLVNFLHYRPTHPSSEREKAPDVPASSVLPHFCGFHQLQTDAPKALLVWTWMSRKGIQNTGLGTGTPEDFQEGVCHQHWSAAASVDLVEAKDHWEKCWP